MANWIQRRLLTAAATCLLCESAMAADDILTVEGELDSPNPPREVRVADIDNENFEFGATGGLISIEDFGTSELVTAWAAYHVTEDFFIEARAGEATADESSFEALAGDALLLPADDRDLSFYDLSLGINLFPGEAFLLDRWRASSSFYLIGGVGATDFAGSEVTTYNAGVGYRLVASDFMAFQVQLRDRVFETGITGTVKDTHNLELSLGISFFF